jgi:hypothetical protein
VNHDDAAHAVAGEDHLRIFRSFAMNCFAARLPFTNLAGFDFRDDRRKADDAERRAAFLTVRRTAVEVETRFLRRRVPPPSEMDNIGGGWPT